MHHHHVKKEEDIVKVQPFNVFVYVKLIFLKKIIDRQSAVHNIHAVSTTAEEEELEAEFMNMKVRRVKKTERVGFFMCSY